MRTVQPSGDEACGTGNGAHIEKYTVSEAVRQLSGVGRTHFGTRPVPEMLHTQRRAKDRYGR